ncbi:diguanylate cyclase (GGDEF) domain-containing protein [Xenococcus sp. PCC 7305]|uniref:putative bifunctional diguanylate cyclase/phosphodiesterase n=1 Tax=Xenococcus sp. PCC 7305 TaxID=102125 RepID=UPI0002ACEFC5|nr:EAL domain-containing protein [Xenococcus sp. PCC 7305]ELS05256.1 diguanylate cyclase (GGDEF) domain-containing protein [Xenococcus sp. PCC 7305]
MFTWRRSSQKLNRSKFRWTLDKKIGGLATGLLLLLGGVSSYFYFEIREICRELEEIAQSDLPIYETANQLIFYNNQKQLLLEELHFISHHYADGNYPEEQSLYISKIAHDLDRIEQDTSKTLSNGIRQAQFAIAEEDKKEDKYRLNQEQEDYQKLKSIFLQLELEHQEFNIIIERFLQQTINDQTSSSLTLIQEARLELQDFAQLTQKITQQIKAHIDGSVSAAHEERSLSIKTNVFITLGSLLFGSVLASFLTHQISGSLKKVTEQAKLIANNIDQENLEHQALVIDSNDEIRDLAVAFNRMVENFLSSQAERKQITEQMLSEKKLAQWQASHDVLTNLVNRREFENQLSQILESEAATGHSLLYLDLDRFKIINDTCGHAAGDELLRQISKVLQNELRSSDTLARLGGDEFAVILHKCEQNNAVEIAQTILLAVQHFCFHWQEQSFTIGVSIGVLSFKSQKDTLTSVLKAADAACYQAKNLGRNQIYEMKNKERELAQKSQEMNWLAEIHQALECDRFVLFYQKIMPLQAPSSGSEHYEVLLRMAGQDGRMIPPMAFIPIAERYQLMNQVDRWVIKNLFATQAHHYRKRGRMTRHASLYAINLSGETLNDNQFVEFIQQELEYHKIPPAFICFEITETVAISNLSQAKLMIQQLQELGCRFALDDFGSGMSSFAYLKNLPVDFLKIDGIFTRELLQDPINSLILKSFHEVAQGMGISTIAEYVDSEEKLAKLKSLGIDYAQGYWVAKPKPLPKLQLLMSKQDVA